MKPIYKVGETVYIRKWAKVGELKEITISSILETTESYNEVLYQELTGLRKIVLGWLLDKEVKKVIEKKRIIYWYFTESESFRRHDILIGYTPNYWSGEFTPMPEYRAPERLIMQGLKEEEICDLETANKLICKELEEQDKKLDKDLKRYIKGIKESKKNIKKKYKEFKCEKEESCDQ